MADGPVWQLPNDRLETSFADKAPPFKSGEAISAALRCVYCHDAPCITACPTSIDIPTFIQKIGTGNLKGSARTILDANLLGSSCSRVCPVEVLCEGACVYVGWGREPVEIGRLQRHAMDRARSPRLIEKAPATGRSVGLIGAGPASLACAGTLVKFGHEATVYEKSDLPGGLNVTGVAPYKMNAVDALDEVAFIARLGVNLELGVSVGGDLRVEELFERHDAVFLGIGLGGDSRLGVPGEDGPGVFGATAWIRAMKNDVAAPLQVRRVAVIGGGNTALDCVRELAGLGVPDVTLVYRRGEDDMSGYRHEWSAAKHAGVRLLPDAVVTAVTRDAGDRVTALELEAATDGRGNGTTMTPFPADCVIVAIGQSKLSSVAAMFPDVTTDDRGRIEVDAATGVTKNPKVFAGGDVVNGGMEVVNAVDEGQRAARGLDAFLRSQGE